MIGLRFSTNATGDGTQIFSGKRKYGYWGFLSLLVGTGLHAQQKPNILWLTFEDTSPQFIGCYGNKDARTPVMDQLAKEGVRFTNAFSTGTVCSPSRCTIITGVRTFAMGTGHHRSYYPIPASIHGFPYYLQQQGYYTTNNSKTDYNVKNIGEFTKEAWNESSNSAGWWNRKPGQPFFAVFNYMDSHQSRTMTDSYKKYLKEVISELPVNDRIGENDFSMPPFYRDSPEMRKQFARVYNSIKLTDNKMGQLLNRLKQDHLMDSTIIFLFADHGEGIPRGKTNGINLGYRVPFVIWFPEMYKDLSPWGKSGVVTDEMVDFEDLAPTLLSLAGCEIPSHMKGRILVGKNRSKAADHLFLSEDRSDNGIDMVRSVTNGKYMYSRNYMPFMPEARYIRYMEHGEIKHLMRTDLAANRLNPLQKSLFQDRPAEFLFDIEKDPWETVNLANDSKMKPVLENMRNELQQDIFSSRDVMFLPEYEIGLISQSTTPYEFRLNELEYPFAQIYKAASLSGMRGKDIAQKQISLLSDKDKFVRYWAAVGLRSQDPETLAAYREKLSAFMDDSYPPVAVTISAIVCDVFESAKARENMKLFCKSENQDLSLMAINYLLYFKNKTPFVETVKTAMKNKTNYNVRSACQDFLISMSQLTYDVAE